MSLVREFFTIVRAERRITVPREFKEGEPIKVRVERIVQEEEEHE